MRIRLIGIIALLCMFAALAHAELLIEKKNGAIYVKSALTSEIEDLFSENDFDEYDKPYGRIPRIYMEKLPEDWTQVKENSAKHRTFIRIMLPLILKVNEEIIAERMLIEYINEKFEKGNQLSDDEINILEDKAKKYDIFTRMQGDNRLSILIKGLLKNIDTVPPSILIASAAAYTDWGMSRLANEANSLYLDEIWYSDEGLKPLDDENADYRYKQYASLEDCIAARALKINSNTNYEYMREARSLSRKINRPPYGEQLVVHFLHDNNMQNILGLIDYTMTHYGLSQADYFPQLVDVK